MIRLGLMQSALDRDDLEKSFQWASQAGAEGMEVSCSSAAEAEFLFSQAGRDRLRELSDRYKVEVPSLGLIVLVQSQALFGPRPDVELATEYIENAIGSCPQAGIKTIMLPFMGKASIQLEEQLHKVVEMLPDFAEMAERAGVVLGIESLLNVNQQVYLLESLSDYNSVKIYFDTGNILPRRMDPAKCLRDLGRDRICQIHLKDVKLTPEGLPPEWDVLLGQGDVDMTAIANSLQAMQYDGWVILETRGMDDPPANAAKNMQFARNLLLR